MKTTEIRPEENLHAERMLAEAKVQANDLIEKSISHSSYLLKKGNLQAISLINQANDQAEQLINTANLNEKRLLIQAASIDKDLVHQASKSQTELLKSADLLTKKTANSAPLNLSKDKAKTILTEAASHARDLVSEADDQAKDLVVEADEKAKVLVRVAALQAKDLVTVAAFQARDLISEAADNTKEMVQEAATQAKDLVSEAARVYIANKMKFLNTAAHELRTPITSISLALELSEKKVSQGVPVTVSFLKQIRTPLERLSRLISYLIDMSRMERKILLLELKKTNLVSLIEECVEELQLQNPNSTFHFSKPDRKVEIMLDPLRINQVLSNIIDNAIRYSGKKMIEITLKALPGIARVEITDQGTGIPKDLQQKLFIPFHRGTSDSTITTSGLGLGLALCYEIIKLHEGRIGLIQTKGQGCTFYFELKT